MEIHYRIVSMQESGFKYMPDFNYNGIDINTVTYQFSHTFTPNAEKGEIALALTVVISPAGSNEVLAKQDIYTVFGIEPFDKVIRINSSGFKTTEPLLIDTFVNISIGALRGMLAKNLKGTPLANSVLPLIPMDIIRQNSERLKEEG